MKSFTVLPSGSRKLVDLLDAIENVEKRILGLLRALKEGQELSGWAHRWADWSINIPASQMLLEMPHHLS